MLGEDRTKRALLGALIMDASPLLELRALNVRFGRVEVLRNFSLSVRRGEFVWLVGPTGSGKSTILRILAGLQQPASGEVVIAGDHVERFSAAQKRWLRRSMGLMMQDCFLLEDRTVESNVMLPALVANEGYAEARRRAYLALEKCGISELGKLKPAALSAGQRQLAMLARAVVNHFLHTFGKHLHRFGAGTSGHPVERPRHHEGDELRHPVGVAHLDIIRSL